MKKMNKYKIIIITENTLNKNNKKDKSSKKN